MAKAIEVGLPMYNRDPTPEQMLNKLNIRYRVCCKFVKKSNEDKNTCVCNRKKDDQCHKSSSMDTQSTVESWDMFRNTSEELNPRNGKLPNGASYTQLALDTPIDKTAQILLNVWNIPQPRLIITIIGGAKYFKLSDRLETNFINGLINVALKSDAWLITNGYNVGIVQLVGQAINKAKLTKPKRNIIAIGVCKWGSIKDVEKLTASPNDRKEIVANEMPKKRESGQRDLELNHTHYLMLDDGRLRYYDIKDYRTRLCAHLAKLNHETAHPVPVVTIVVEGGRDTLNTVYYDLKAKIPIMIIDGSGRVADFFKRWLLYTKEFDEPNNDTDTIYEINEIDQVTPIPFIVNSQENLSSQRQRLQEMFQKYDKQLREDLNSIINQEDDSSKRRRRSKQFSNPTNSKTKSLDESASRVMYCLQPAVRSGISIFNLNSDNDLSEIIFRSICKSQQKHFERRENDQLDVIDAENRKRQSQLLSPRERQHQAQTLQHINRRDQSVQRTQLLDLAMNWNCIDVARELILENSLDNILDKDNAFTYALCCDLSAFVAEFLKLGLDPSEIFFPNSKFIYEKSRYKKLIKDLYTVSAVNSDTTHLRWFIGIGSDSTKPKEIRSTDDLNDALSLLIGDYMSKLYFQSNADEKRYQTLWALNDNESERSRINMNAISNDNHEIQDRAIVHDYTMRDLFLWAILMNRIDLARVLLSYMKYRICAALIATKILKEYHKTASHGDLKDSYMKNANYFQQYAIDCVTQCEKNDPDLACQIILQRIQLYGNVTCLQVAADARDKLFIATPCAVQAMNNIWFDKINPNNSIKQTNITMGVGFLSLGLLAPYFVAYRKSAKESKLEPDSRTLQPYGIDYADPYPLEYPRFVKNQLINRYMHRLKHFHQALRMKYFYHCLTYIVYLLLFSYTLLFKFQLPTNEIPSIYWTEIVTIILVSCMLIEEIHYFVSLDNLSFPGKCSSYFRNLFKIMATVEFMLFYVGLVLRFTYAADEEQFMSARVVMAVTLEISWLRSLSFLIVVRFLGPHIVAIGKMLKDLAFFMCIIVIVMAGYGVASRSMTYYPRANRFNDTEISTNFDGRSIFRQIAYPVYYLMYGEFNNELSDLDEYPDAGWSISTHVLLAVHMLFVNILLTNLLIAMFSKRFDQVYEDTQNIWHSQQYMFTREYFTRSPLFPPISLIYDMYYLCRLTYFNIRRVCFKKSADPRAKVFKMIPIHKDCIKDWHEFESASTYEYAHQEAKATTHVANISSSSSERNDVGNRQDKYDSLNGSNDSNMNLQHIQDNLAKLNQSFEDIKRQLKMLTEKAT